MAKNFFGAELFAPTPERRRWYVSLADIGYVFFLLSIVCMGVSVVGAFAWGMAWLIGVPFVRPSEPLQFGALLTGLASLGLLLLLLALELGKDRHRAKRYVPEPAPDDKVAA